MRALSILIFFLTSSFVLAQKAPHTLSPNAEISVLTIGAGPELYDSFGHTAVRVRDFRQGIDIVFNYGLFDFDTPNFYTKFAQGKLLYRLGISHFDDFLANYIEQQRLITSQKLIQSPKEKQALFSFLLNNAKKENSKYLYDFLYDNCATRPANAINNIYTKDIFTDFTPEIEGLSHRDLIQQNVPWNTWGSFGMDIAIGSVTDRPVSNKEYLFLPEYTMEALSTAQGTNGAITAPAQILYEPKTLNTYKENVLFSPLVIFCIIALILLYNTYLDYRNKRGIRLIDKLILGITGFIGILLALLWFATDHSPTKWNYNILWAFPFHLIAAFTIKRSANKKWLYPYIKLSLILLVLLIFHWIIGVQGYPITLAPLLIALGVRYSYLIGALKKTIDDT